MRTKEITIITVTPEVAAALCPDGEHNADCYAHGMIACGRCPLNAPKDGDVIMLRVKTKPKAWPDRPKIGDIMVGS